MKQNHRDALNSLLGLRVLEIGRAADLLWVHFGSWREVPNRTGGTRTVGDWALHIQAPWRIVRDQSILVGELDMYRYLESGEEFDWQADGESRFDRIAYTLNAALEAAAQTVESVNSDGVGGFSLRIEQSVSFDVFSNASSGFPCTELWRLFQPTCETEHFVVETLGDT